MRLGTSALSSEPQFLSLGNGDADRADPRDGGQDWAQDSSKHTPGTGQVPNRCQFLGPSASCFPHPLPGTRRSPAHATCFPVSHHSGGALVGPLAIWSPNQQGPYLPFNPVAHLQWHLYLQFLSLTFGIFLLCCGRNSLCSFSGISFFLFPLLFVQVKTNPLLCMSLD